MLSNISSYFSLSYFRTQYVFLSSDPNDTKCETIIHVVVNVY